MISIHVVCRRIGRTRRMPHESGPSSIRPVFRADSVWAQRPPPSLRAIDPATTMAARGADAGNRITPGRALESSGSDGGDNSGGAPCSLSGPERGYRAPDPPDTSPTLSTREPRVPRGGGGWRNCAAARLAALSRASIFILGCAPRRMPTHLAIAGGRAGDRAPWASARPRAPV